MASFTQQGPLTLLPPPMARIQFEPDADVTALTIVIVTDSETRLNTPAAVTRLAELAVNDELVVVCGSNEHEFGLNAPIVAAGLRDRLPRHDVVALHVAPHARVLQHSAALVADLLEEGSVPVVVTPTAAARGIATELSGYLHADRVLAVTCTPTGAALQQVWLRPAATGQSACLAC